MLVVAAIDLHSWAVETQGEKRWLTPPVTRILGFAGALIGAILGTLPAMDRFISARPLMTSSFLCENASEIRAALD